MTIASFSLLASIAFAGSVDEYASRYDWACTYGNDSTTCGGPDSWFGIDAAHTVILCGQSPDVEICGHTWRVSGQDALLKSTLEVWAAAAEGELGDSHWVLTPSTASPDLWLGLIRGKDTLAALEVSRGYVQVRMEPRDPCVSKGLGERLDPYVKAILADGEKGEDPIAPTLALAWAEADFTEVGEMTAELAASIVDRPVKETFPDRESFQRWTLLASEPFRCAMELRNESDPKAGLKVALDEWRKFVRPTPEELRERKKREREEARIARKGQDVDVKEEGLEDE